MGRNTLGGMMPREDSVPLLTSKPDIILLDRIEPHIVKIDPASPFQGLWSTFYEDTYRYLIEHELIIAKEIDIFPNEEIAKRILLRALRDSGHYVIRIIQPWYRKIGKAHEVWGFMQDGMTTHEFLHICLDFNHKKQRARAEIDYNVQNGLIQLV